MAYKNVPNATECPHNPFIDTHSEKHTKSDQICNQTLFKSTIFSTVSFIYGNGFVQLEKADLKNQICDYQTCD
ncbi:hypothetical protein GJ496_006961 [Pomphorhynchus laevis]|nr:hypothetical protein GJ496_006961 [Pomphorhynchus laevis]